MLSPNNSSPSSSISCSSSPTPPINSDSSSNGGRSLAGGEVGGALLLGEAGPASPASDDGSDCHKNRIVLDEKAELLENQNYANYRELRLMLQQTIWFLIYLRKSVQIGHKLSNQMLIFYILFSLHLHIQLLTSFK